MRHPVLALVGAAAALLAVPAGAQSSAPSSRTNLMNLMNAASVAPISYQRGGGGTHSMSFRGGAMVSPNVGGLVGADFQLPTLSLGYGWHGRLDADVIFSAHFVGFDTIIPVTFDQLYYTPGSASGHNFYYGGGLGVVLGGPGVFDAKLILGTELTSRLGAELNVHFTEHDTLLTLLGRVHL